MFEKAKRLGGGWKKENGACPTCPLETMFFIRTQARVEKAKKKGRLEKRDKRKIDVGKKKPSVQRGRLEKKKPDLAA